MPAFGRRNLVGVGTTPIPNSVKIPVQSKCLIASIGFHTALAVLLVFGPAFAPKAPELVILPTLTLHNLNLKSIDQPFVKLPTPQPSPPNKVEPPKIENTQPEPPRPEPERPPETKKQAVAKLPATPEEPEVAPPPVSKLEPKRNDLKPAATLPEEPSTATTTTKPVVTTSKEIRTSSALVKSTADKPSDRRTKKEREPVESAKEREEARQWLAQEKARQDAKLARAKALSDLESKLHSRATVSDEISLPTTSGDDAYAPWNAQLKALYQGAWNIRKPAAVTVDFVVVNAAVRIDRSGTVLSWQLSNPSGIPAVDKSVESVLRDLRRVPPFPSAAKESERTVTIKFKVEGSSST